MPASTRIEDYALIGDLQTAALVSREGSIDWCCFPRFDSGACFAAILGRPDHGRWLLAPATRIEHASRRYRRDTLILESIFTTATGRVRTIDFMPPRRDGPGIVRIVEGLEGRVPIRSQLVVRFDFGRVLPWVRRLDDALVAIAGPDGLCLRTPVEAHGEQMTTVSDFVVEAGERIPFVLTWFPSHEDLPEPIDPEQALDESESYWLEWANSCEHTGEYHEEIHRSLRVLKALTYAPTGGIVAAPTTSLPELIGGVRNWDYRFCWLRDATLTLLTMLNAGYRHEAEAWRQWLLRAVAGAPGDLQIMYGIAGERRLEERELDWLPGYLDSRPVRVGNAASQQLQLDVYGEVLDALYQALVHGAAPDDNAWSILTQLLRWLEEGWRQKDCGIWEVRGSPRHFTHSKVMAWVAFDRAVRLHGEFGRQGAVARWRALREEIRTEILARAWSPKKRVFVQAYDSDRLDASVLQMPLVGFLPARDPRIVSTVERIQRELTIDGLVLRYRPEKEAVDGLPGGEAAFLPCSFWLVQVLALQGRLQEGRELFERLLDLRNDVGLLSEEYDPVSGRQLGNFPQAFSHLALVDAAITLGEGRAIVAGREAGCPGAAAGARTPRQVESLNAATASVWIGDQSPDSPA
jgi:GH15 family glucan-1,4-alpha-glucosidase